MRPPAFTTCLTAEFHWLFQAGWLALLLWSSCGVSQTSRITHFDAVHKGGAAQNRGINNTENWSCKVVPSPLNLYHPESRNSCCISVASIHWGWVVFTFQEGSTILNTNSWWSSCLTDVILGEMEEMELFTKLDHHHYKPTIPNFTTFPIFPSCFMLIHRLIHRSHVHPWIHPMVVPWRPARRACACATVGGSSSFFHCTGNETFLGSMASWQETARFWGQNRGGGTTMGIHILGSNNLEYHGVHNRIDIYIIHIGEIMGSNGM